MTQDKILEILKKENLQLTERGFFRNKQGVARVKNEKGEKLILKTERLEPFQAKLFQITKEMENELCFRVPAIKSEGKDYFVMEEIGGKSLNEFVEDNPESVLNISKDIADDYQKVLAKLLKEEVVEDLLSKGKSWTLGSILTWSGPIVEAGLLEYSDIKKVANEMERTINEKGEDFLGWAHGNIISDHIIVKDNDFYLLDLAIKPRVGRGYYDWLRALDFAFLKTKNTTEFARKIPQWLDKYLPNENRQEVNLVLANRLLGILGWDILYHKVEYVVGDLEIKKREILKIIQNLTDKI